MNLTADFTCWQSIQKLQKTFQGAKTKELKSGQEKIHSVRWSPDGSRLASGSADSFLKVWTFHQATSEFILLNEYHEHSNSITQLCWNPTDSNTFATASLDKSVLFWDVREGKSISKIQSIDENINFSWSPDGHQVAIGTKSDQIKIVDIRNMQPIFDQKFTIEINEFGWGKTMQQFILTTGHGTIQVYNTASYNLQQTLNAHTSNCYCLDFDSTGRFFATGGADAVILVWDCKSFIPVQSFTSLTSAPRTLAFSYDGNCVAAGSEDKVLEIWRMETGQSLVQIPVNSPVNTLAWHPFKQLVAFAEDLSSDRSSGLKIFGFENC